MATNADFDALIVRIDTATTTLENSVDAVANGAGDIEQAVTEAQQAATTATQQATQASNSATAAATASGNAQTQATNAANAATTAIDARNEAQAAVADAQDLVDDLLATAPFQEAPTDGGIYGRQNATWTLVDTGGTPVASVNGELPDAQGNVTVEVPTLTSELTNDSGFITAAEVPPSGIEEAPNDGQQYARQDGEWAVVTGGEGTVTSVNSIAPDVNGDVTLSASDVGAKPSSYIPTWSEVSGKPTAYPTNWSNVADKPTTYAPSAHTHAASDITSGAFDVARIPSLTTSKITNGVFSPARLGSGATGATKVLYGDGTWKDAPSGGGGNTDVGVTFTYDGVERTTWPVADRLEAINLALVTVNGITGVDLFANTTRLSSLPVGKYYFNLLFTTGALANKWGVITVDRASGSQKSAWAVVRAGDGDTAGRMYTHFRGDGTWLPV